MILTSELDIDEDLIGESDSIEASIDNDNLNFVFNLVSTRFYSNPIGSIVREYASNAWDAHIEMGHNKPIIVHLAHDYENNSYYIEFVDTGIGISEERFEKVFMKYFSSSKRDSNVQIGGFGLN